MCRGVSRPRRDHGAAVGGRPPTRLAATRPSCTRGPAPHEEPDGPPVSGIDREQVAHLARLARLALDDDELDGLAAQLDVILDAVATIARGHRRRRRPARPPTRCRSRTSRAPTSCARRCRRDAGARRRAGRRGRPLPRARASWRRSSMTDDLDPPTAVETRAAIAAGEASAVEVAQAHLDRIAAVDGDVHAFLHVDAEGALAQAARVDARRRLDGPARRGAARAQGRALHRGRPDHGRLAHPRGLAPAVRRDRHRAAQGRRRGHPRQDQHGRVRDGLLHRAQRLRPDAQPVGPRPHPRRLRRRVRGGRRRLRGAAGDRHRHRRVHPAARRRHRHRRRQADLRRRLPLRPRRLQQQPRPGRPLRAHRAGRRPAPRGRSPATTRPTPPPSPQPVPPVVEAARRPT